MKKHAVRTVLIAVGVVAVAAIAVNVSFIGRRNDTAVPVRTHRVSVGTLEDVVSGNGSLNPRTTVNVAPQVSGEVSAVLVAVGDEVAKGAVLFTIRADDYLLARDKAASALEVSRRGVSQSLVTLRAQYRSAAMSLADATRGYERNRELYAAKAVSQEVYQRSQDALTSAQTAERSAREQLNLRSGLDLGAEPILTPDRDEAIIESAPEVVQAALNLRSAEDSVRKCSVTAPGRGTVTLVKPGVGDFAQAGVAAVRVESLRDIVAEVQIDEVDIAQVAVGQRAEVTSDSLIGRTLGGSVVSVAPTVSTLGNTRVSLVRIQVDPVDFALRAGASCKARIRTQTKTGVLVLPLTAFVSDDTGSFVYRLGALAQETSKGDAVYRLERVAIQTGVSDVSLVEVTAGLAEGDLVATGSLNLLRDGIRVTEKQQETP